MSGRVFRLGDQKKNLSFTILLMMSLNFSHLANCSNLATSSLNCVVAWEYCLAVDEHVLDANLSLSANRCAWRWQWCLLHLLSFASSGSYLTNVHVLLRQRRVLCLALMQDGPILPFLFGCILWLEILFDTSRCSDLAGECVCCFSQHFWGCSRALWNIWEPSVQPTVLPLGVPVEKNKCACCENIEAIDDVLENFFSTSSLGPRSSKSTFTICVSRSCVLVTRTALYCVCDHATELMNAVSVLRRLSTDLMCHCYHATGLSVLLP